MFWKFYGFLFHLKYLRNLSISNVCVFPYISGTMEIYFPHVLGILWIPAWHKIFKKSVNLKCLCFPVLFSYYRNPLSQCFGNCMNFCFNQKFNKSMDFKCLFFPLLFSYYGSPLYPCFGNCIDFSFIQNIWERHNFGVSVFSHTFTVLWNFTFPKDWEW